MMIKILRGLNGVWGFFIECVMMTLGFGLGWLATLAGFWPSITEWARRNGGDKQKTSTTSRRQRRQEQMQQRKASKADHAR
jgi:hypothetical protein